MASILIIEDGTGKTNSNSYITAIEARAWATLRGITLSSVDATLEPMIVQACDWLESIAVRFKGYRSNSTQALQWPRSEVYIDEEEFPADEIPQALKNAQCRLVIEISNGIDLLPTRNEAFVVEEKVGPATTKFLPTSFLTKPSLTYVESLLIPIINGNSSGLICGRI